MAKAFVSPIRFAAVEKLPFAARPAYYPRVLETSPRRRAAAFVPAKSVRHWCHVEEWFNVYPYILTRLRQRIEFWEALFESSQGIGHLIARSIDILLEIKSGEQRRAK
jgi:hypothetical protein